MRVCKIELCEGKHHCKGYCAKHYGRLLRWGDPTTVSYSYSRGLSTFERYKTHVRRDDNGYWVWIAHTNDKGYGKFYVDGKTVRAHRYVYEYYFGPVPDGMEIDHCCRIPNCVDIRCLDAITHADNIYRKTLSAEDHWALRPNREV